MCHPPEGGTNGPPEPPRDATASLISYAVQDFLYASLYKTFPTHKTNMSRRS